MIEERPEIPPPAARVFRSIEGRRLGGVCAGLAPLRGLGAGWIRLAFVVAALAGGLGIIAYLACWLIIPAHEGPATRRGPSGRGSPSSLVVVAWATAAVVLLALLALLSAVATVFGLGWAMFALGSVVPAAVLVPRLRLRPLWALPVLAALTVPSVAVALSPVRLALQSGATAVTPARAATTAPGATYRSGFGPLLVDLRRTRFSPSGTVQVRIDAGIRRTIVALPQDRCVRVVVRYAIHPFARRLASLLTGTAASADYGVILFGAWHGTWRSSGTSGLAVGPAARPGPVLRIDFVSQGGSLFVCDYPTSVSPTAEPNWPGFHVTPEPRPYLKGEPRRAVPGIIKAWKARRRAEVASANAVNPLIPGPCDPPRAVSSTAGNG